MGNNDLTISSITVDNNSAYHYCTYPCSCNTTPNIYTYWYPTITTICKYEISCPKCSTKNWMELEIITPCKKCKSSLKAVSKKVDYEIEVD